MGSTKTPYSSGTATPVSSLSHSCSLASTFDSIIPRELRENITRRSSSSGSHYDDGTTACVTPVSDQELANNNAYEKKALSKSIEFASDFTTFSYSYSLAAYNINKLAERDDEDRWPLWKQRLNRLTPFTSALSIASYLSYFSLRIYSTIAAQNKFHQIFAMAWAYITAEILVAVPALLQQTWHLMAIKGRRRPKLRLGGDFAPTVNVLITCCGEDVDVVLDTARAACAVDYPSDRFRVIVTDDKASPELRKAIEDLKSTFPNLYYFARVKEKGKPHHFKAGNLIAATDFGAGLEGGQSEYIACLDADMIPEEQWLRTMLAHLIVDPLCGLACPPQCFMNVPDNDPLVQSLDTFIHVIEPVKDACGVAWCTGSGYVIRVSALENIEGWPTGSLAEDTYTSSKLLGKGWRTAYVHEALQFGTVPDDLPSHLKQRTRWTLGTLQTAVKLRFCIWGPVVKHMTFLQRFSGIVFCTDAFSKVFVVISLFTIPTVLLTGHRMVAYSTYRQLFWQVLLACITHLTGRLSEYIMYLPAGYRQGQRDTQAMLWMSPYHALTVIRSFLLPTALGGKSMAFSSSGSQPSPLEERNPARRAPLPTRLRVTLWDCKAWMHVLYITVYAAAIVLSVVRAFTEHHTRHDVLLYILTHAGWPPLAWIASISACATPIKYAIFPPTVPGREELLERDAKTGVARAKGRWRSQRWGGANWVYELQVETATAYTMVCFVGVFFIGGWVVPV